MWKLLVDIKKISRKSLSKIKIQYAKSVSYTHLDVYKRQTLIQSNPSNAKLYIDGQHVGQTPYKHRDSKIVGSSLMVKIEKEGYQPLITTITKDEEVNVGAIVGGLFFVVPFLWTMQYQPCLLYTSRCV